MSDGKSNVVALRAEAAPFLRVVEHGPLPLSQRSDETLMLEHGHGSEDSYAELVRRHQKGVLNFIFRMVHNRHIAEELTQEVFMALVKNAQRYEPTAKFTTYLYAIASNIVSKEWARQKRRPKFFSLSGWFGGEGDEEFDLTEQMPDERSCVFAAFQRGEVSEAVNTALKQLPEHQREAFVLRRFQDMPYEEIAEILDVPVGTAKSRVVRAERALRPLLARFQEYL
jgi:RNA polymerase sigma-70 factor (ECF subfamily)